MSTDSVVMRDLPVDAVTTADTSIDLRGGVWTRLGNGNVRGDEVTESTLRRLAEQSREAARAQGYAAGWAEGRRGSMERLAATHDEQSRAFDEQGRRIVADQRSSANALNAAALRFEEATRLLHEDLADQAVELALQIAEAVIGREIELSVDPGADAVRRAIAAVPADVPLQVRLHPADLAALDDSVLAERTVGYVADASLSRGDAVVESESGIVDCGVSAALARVREVLGR